MIDEMYGPGRPPKPAYPDPPVNLRQLAIAAADKVTKVTWRQGTKATRGNPTAAMTGHFVVIRVRPANRDIPAAPAAPCPTAGYWPNGPRPPMSPPTTGCPPCPTTPTAQLVRLAKIRWRIEPDYRELKHGLGLDHFEGRSYQGRHRHVTMTALAQAFCTKIRTDPKAPTPG